MSPEVLLACDWGTTNVRAWTLDARGAVVSQQDFSLGVSRLAPGEAALRFEAEVRAGLNAQMLPAILCGMIGSNLGWAPVPYLECPAGLRDLAGSLTKIAKNVSIVPGLRCDGIAGSPDVMRGEETQILGWLAQHPERQSGRVLLCHPGTHAKWVVIEDGRITRFVTAMTGELFAVLSAHSVLKSDGLVTDEIAFEEGLKAAGRGDALASRLFTARARVVGAEARAESTSSYLSGLLIGSEVASVPHLLGVHARRVVLLGDAILCGRYRQALLRGGVEVEVFDGEAAAVAGLFALAARPGA